jgi:hypothetical protein
VSSQLFSRGGRRRGERIGHSNMINPPKARSSRSTEFTQPQDRPRGVTVISGQTTSPYDALSAWSSGRAREGCGMGACSHCGRCRGPSKPTGAARRRRAGCGCRDHDRAFDQPTPAQQPEPGPFGEHHQSRGAGGDLERAAGQAGHRNVGDRCELDRLRPRAGRSWLRPRCTTRRTS